MSRKRKSVPPRRLDAAAREEHNWEVNKEDAPQVLAPPAHTKEDDDVVLLAEKPVSEKDKDNLQEPNEEESHRAQEKNFAQTLNRLQQLYEQDFPQRAAKKPRKTILPSFTIPFNKAKDGSEEYVELTNLTVMCDRHNEAFYSSIDEGTHHLYTRFVGTESPNCDLVKENGEVMASAKLELPQAVIDSLFFLQKRGYAYVDAFPVVDGANYKMYIRVFFTQGAFVTCSPINSNTKGINNHIKEVINFVYSLARYDASNISNDPDNNENNNNATSTTTASTSEPITTNQLEITTASPSVIATTQENEANGSQGGEDREGVNELEMVNQYHFDPLQVYSAVKPTNHEPQLDPAPLAGALVPTLRPYQLRAAYWMLQREQKIHKEEPKLEVDQSKLLHPLWTECNSQNGKTFYYNSITGMLTFQKFTVDGGEFSATIPGGILADEPGLGKTLEVLALILSNPHPPISEDESGEGRGKEETEKEKENEEKGKEANAAEMETSNEEGKKTGKEKGKGKGKAKKVAANNKASKAQASRKKRRKFSDIREDGEVYDDPDDDEEFQPSSSSPTKKGKAAPKKSKNGKEESEEREEVVNCPCGRQEIQHPNGLWICCDACSSWLFAACIGYRPSKHQGDEEFLCPKCSGVVEVERPFSEEDMIDARATLIVCPLAIREQWRQEIERHSVPGALSVRVYRGVRSGDLATPSELAKFDIVLTTYDVLRTELDHIDTTGREGSLRSKKRYQITPTPLTSLIWWRICLDEAQMVESTATKAAMMALQLTTRHRWCVTGTPIQRGLEDLFGLCLFLQASPFDDKFWWHNAIQSPYEKEIESAKDRLHNFLKPIMWRNTKVDVAHELQLPEQKEKEVKLLRFSAVESTFYRKQHEECSIKARATLRTFSNRGSPITTRLRSAKILRPLLRLRQACCHPQVGSRGIRALQKNSLTMDELLDHLNMTAKVDCQEAQRAVLASTNGLAALDIINDDLNAAAEKYRSALRLIESNEGVIDADKFQQLHIYHNLAEMVEIGNLSANTLRDGTFKGKAEALRNQIVAYRENVATDELRKVRDVTAKVVLDPSFCKPKPSSRGTPWWLEAAAFLEQNRLFRDFMTRMSQLEHNNKSATAWQDLRDTSGLSMALTVAYDELFKMRNTLLEKVNELDAPLSRADVTIATCCQMCAKTEKKTKGVTCANCQCLTLIEQYQKNLFSVIVKKSRGKDESEEDEDEAQKTKEDHAEDEEEDESELWWAQKGTNAYGSSEYEHILTVLVAMVRLHDRNHPMLQSAQMQFDALSTMREECKKIAAFVVAKQDLVNVLDEVDMAVTRIRLRYPGEPVRPAEQLYKLHPAEVDLTRTRLSAELVVHETELKKMKGQLHYLKSLGEARKRQALRRQQRDRENPSIPSESSAVTDPTDPNFASSSTSRAPIATSSDANSKPILENSPALENSSSILENTIPSIENAKSQNPNDENHNPTTNRSSQNIETSLASLHLSSSTPANVNSFTSKTDNVHITTPAPTSSEQTSASPYKNNPNNNNNVNTSFESTTSDDVALAVDDDESTCPICREAFSSDVVILMCGHTFCYECMMFMIERIKLGNTFKCPSCRTRVNIDEISYVSEGSGTQGEYAHINVKGSWGTKIEAVVREILMLQQVEPGTKVLLFSQWNEVLEIVSRALAENGIKFARVQGKRSVEKAINAFKKESNITALLLPVTSGANGLNLVEATHVFLIDPLLNPAAEAQAINRVHRIGQTKVTLIHRFIVGGTIEEKVWSLGKHKAEHQHSDFWRMQSKKEHDLLTLKDFCDLFADVNGNV